MFRTSASRLANASALAALSGCVLGTGAAQAATPVESLTAATPVAAYAGTAMWSRLDPATGRYQLVQAIAGRVPTVVAVAQRDGAFDVDLGSNSRGTTYAVYSRNGDLYRLNPRTAVERKLTTFSSPTRAERSPAIWRGRIAFVRRAAGRDQLRIRDMSSHTSGTRLLLERKAIEGVELGAKHVTWIDRLTNGLPSSKYRVHVRNIATGRDRVVYEAGGGGASFTTITRPAVTPNATGFLWAVARKGVTGSRIVKYTLRTGTLTYAHGSPSYASLAWVSDELGAIVSSNAAGDPYAGIVDCGGDGDATYCNVRYTGALRFNLKP